MQIFHCSANSTISIASRTLFDSSRTILHPSSWGGRLVVGLSPVVCWFRLGGQDCFPLDCCYGSIHFPFGYEWSSLSSDCLERPCRVLESAEPSCSWATYSALLTARVSQNRRQPAGCPLVRMPFGRCVRTAARFCWWGPQGVTHSDQSRYYRCESRRWEGEQKATLRFACCAWPCQFPWRCWHSSIFCHTASPSSYLYSNWCCLWTGLSH